MRESSKRFSTYSLEENLRRLKYEDWLSAIQSYSKKYQRFGAFLPPQEILLKQVYDSLTQCNAKVISFTAPPASGKTHVITLCAAYLCKKGFSTCIVTPNGELKLDFSKELMEVNGVSKSLVPIESINTYRKRKNTFDYVLVDEAHNLRSAIELDNTIVKSFHFEETDPLFDYITSGIDRKKYIAKELNIETASDILRRISQTADRGDAQYLLGRLSQWRVFAVVFGKFCDLRFLLADPNKRNLLPKGRLFLFSATRLEEEELAFYCNIPQNILRTMGEKTTKFIPRENVTYRYISCASDADKIDCITTLLRDKLLSTLILLNSNSKCLSMNAALPKDFASRIVLVKSGLRYAERVKAFERFTQNQQSILMTSSNVYWEGITIKNLKILIIPNIPFPQPTLLELSEGKATEYHKIANRRLIQGMGRIGRVPQEKGICLLLFKPSSSFSYIKENSLDEIRYLLNNL